MEILYRMELKKANTKRNLIFFKENSIPFQLNIPSDRSMVAWDIGINLEKGHSGWPDAKGPPGAESVLKSKASLDLGSIGTALIPVVRVLSSYWR